MRSTFCVLGVGCLLMISANAEAGTVIYVDADATGQTHDGTSWCTAYIGLQQALDVATTGSTIRVANGTYRPSKRTDPADPRSASFQLINGVTIEGGNAGCGAAEPDERNVLEHETVLSGDLNGDDGPDFANNTENVYHVARGFSLSPASVLDGVTITGGNSEGPTENVGAGLYGGGGLGGEPVVSNCSFVQNSARSGGAVEGFSGTFINCTFRNNRALSSFEGGGAVRAQFVHPAFMNCSFEGNSALDADGGAVWARLSTVTLLNCAFRANVAQAGGGAVYSFAGSSLSATNCTFAANGAQWGGGVFQGTGSTALKNCILWGNRPNAIYFESGSLAVSHSDIDSILWPGAGNISQDPLFVRSPNDGGDGWGIGDNDDFGDLRLRPGSPCIDAGRNADVPLDVTTDLEGNPRYVDDPCTLDCPQPGADCGAPPIVDMGAFEFQAECEIDAECQDTNECTRDVCLNCVCEHTNYSAGEPCGDPSDTPCDKPDNCDGFGTCRENNKPVGTVCGDAGGPCTNQDYCDGFGQCHDSGFKPATTACGDPTDDECNNPDHCSGFDGSCLNEVEPPGTSCGDAEGACTNQDYCDGTGGCTDNGFKDSDTPCGNNADTECDKPDHCSGTDGSCEPNYEAAGTPCGDASDTDCTDPDTCNGSGACQSNNLPDGTSCDDGNACTANDTCAGGACGEWGYPWTGFFQPVDNAPTYNRVKAGSAIPLKFSLGCDQGLEIFESGYPKSSRVACTGVLVVDEIESTVTAGGSSLSYDPVANQYIYVWKTDKAWASTCRVLNVKLADGTSHYAYFTFIR